jgi:hypothetical protein
VIKIRPLARATLIQVVQVGRTRQTASMDQVRRTCIFMGRTPVPSGTSDNILLNIRPSPRGRDGLPGGEREDCRGYLRTRYLRRACTATSRCCGRTGRFEWQNWQKKLLIQYDNTTTWLGQSPPPGGPPVLPKDEQLWYQNQQEMKPPNPRVATVLHRRLPHLLQHSEMEWSADQYGSGARNALVSRAQAWIDGP